MEAQNHDTDLQDIPQIVPTAEETPQPREKKRPRVTYYLMLGIFASVFLLSAVYLGHYFWQSHQAASGYGDLASLRESLKNESPSQEATTGPSDSATDPSETTMPPMLPEMEALYQLNNDIVGWLTMSNLRVDYPVMQTPADPNYYLYRDFDGSDSNVGCLYARESCDIFTPSDNIVIYGHAMKTGDMFGRLAWYRDKSYFDSHQTFTFDTLYEHHTYQIFAVFKTSGTYGIGYPYHLFENATSEEEFDQFIADVKGAAFTTGGYLGSSLYDTGITPKYGDKLLTLSTCEYSVRDPDGEKNGRFVIMAVRID